MPTKDQRTQFDYLLNAMEAAAQHENPADHGYAQKRQALYAYVRGLENRPSPLATPDTLPPVAVGDIVLIAPSASRDAFPRLISEERHAVYMNSEDGRADFLAIPALVAR